MEAASAYAEVELTQVDLEPGKFAYELRDGELYAAPVAGDESAESGSTQLRETLSDDAEVLEQYDELLENLARGEGGELRTRAPERDTDTEVAYFVTTFAVTPEGAIVLEREDFVLEPREREAAEQDEGEAAVLTAETDDDRDGEASSAVEGGLLQWLAELQSPADEAEPEAVIAAESSGDEVGVVSAVMPEHPPVVAVQTEGQLIEGTKISIRELIPDSATEADDDMVVVMEQLPVAEVQPESEMVAEPQAVVVDFEAARAEKATEQPPVAIEQVVQPAIQSATQEAAPVLQPEDDGPQPPVARAPEVASGAVDEVPVAEVIELPVAPLEAVVEAVSVESATDETVEAVEVGVEPAAVEEQAEPADVTVEIQVEDRTEEAAPEIVAEAAPDVVAEAAAEEVAQSDTETESEIAESATVVADHHLNFSINAVPAAEKYSDFSAERREPAAVAEVDSVRHDRLSEAERSAGSVDRHDSGAQDQDDIVISFPGSAGRRPLRRQPAASRAVRRAA